MKALGRHSLVLILGVLILGIFATARLSTADLRSPAWYDEGGVGAPPDWHYRVAVNVPAGAAIDATIRIDVDFNALLGRLGVSGAVDSNSPRVVRPNGGDTGLAITPGVTQGQNGPVEQPGQWGITHTGSGALISGPYDDLSKAQQLASQLSELRWTEAKMPKSDIMKAKGIIKAFATSGGPSLPAAKKVYSAGD
jgi:hypothetical protein